MSSVVLFNLAATASLLVVAIFAPQTGAGFLRRLDRAFTRFSQQHGQAVLVVFLTALVGRAVLLPWIEVPEPMAHDEFGHLLAGDTFASGRVANPPHPLWRHFETMHVLQQPVYGSMLPPMQGLFLAIGQLVTGNPWMGALLSTALMCASICWMLQGWLPPKWALLGGLLAVVQLSIVGYWINTRWGGAPGAIGGALLFGALPRIVRQTRVRDAIALVAGVAILANSRPYEGFVAALVVAVALACLLGRLRGPALTRALWRCVLPATVGMIIVSAATGYYFWRLTGDPLRMPYQASREIYASAMYFIWQQPRPAPEYRNEQLREYYQVAEMERFHEETRDLSARGLLTRALEKMIAAPAYVLGPTLTWPLLLAPWGWRNRRTRFLLVAFLVLVAALTVEVFYFPHYVSPFVGVMYALSLEGLRRVYVTRWRGRRVGQFFVRAFPFYFLLLFAVGLATARNPMCQPPEWPGIARAPYQPARGRQTVANALKSQGGQHLAIVRYLGQHDVHLEWVFNEADIDRAEIVWARELSAAENQELLRYFHGRKVWLIEREQDRVMVQPYPRAAR